MNDIEIIKRYLDWDLDSFWFIYDKYIDKIYKFVYMKVNNKEFTEDIVSDVFLSSLNNIKFFRLDNHSSFKSWLYKIAYNKIIDFYKNRDKNKTEEFWDYLDVAFKENFWSNIDNKDKLIKVFDYLKTLKKEHRDVLIYRIWEDLSFKEISEITWMSIDNCKKISSRTLKIINEKFIILLFLLII